MKDHGEGSEGADVLEFRLLYISSSPGSLLSRISLVTSSSRISDSTLLKCDSRVLVKTSDQVCKLKMN